MLEHLKCKHLRKFVDKDSDTTQHSSVRKKSFISGVETLPWLRKVDFKTSLQVFLSSDNIAMRFLHQEETVHQFNGKVLMKHETREI